MADAVTKVVMADSATHYIIHLTNIGDGTGESAVCLLYTSPSPRDCS